MEQQSQLNISERKKIMLQEYAKCVLDCSYFLKKYAIIQHPLRGKIRFLLYVFQEEVLKQFLKFKYNIVLKSRQLGLSTLSAGYCLWIMLFHDDKNILVVAKDKDTAKNLVTKVRVMYDALPIWLKKETTENNKLSLRFINGSQIKAVAATPDAGRSEALSLLILDEAAFIEFADEIWAAAQQTLATGGDCIILSTPNGRGNWFHKMWVKANKKDNIFAKGDEIEEEINPTTRFNQIRLVWSIHPEHDEKWRKEQDDVLGARMAKQECDADFLSSGNTVIEPDVLQKHELTVSMPIETRGIEGAYWIWKRPDPTKNYIITVDTARGDGADNSAIEVFDDVDMEQQAEYNGKLPPKELGKLAVLMATEYNMGMLVVELQGIGYATIDSVRECGYRNIYYSLKGEDKYLLNEEAMILKGMDLALEEDMIAGFSTSQKKRPLMISKVEVNMREEYLTIHSRRLKDEFDVFIWDGRKARAMSGFTDDLVMCVAMYAWSRDTILRLKTMGTDLTKVTLNNISSQTQDFSAIYDTNNRYSGAMASSQWKMSIGNINGQAKEDISWMVDKQPIEKKLAELDRLYTQQGKPIPEAILKRLGINKEVKTTTTTYKGVYKR